MLARQCTGFRIDGTDGVLIESHADFFGEPIQVDADLIQSVNFFSES